MSLLSREHNLTGKDIWRGIIKKIQSFIFCVQLHVRLQENRHVGFGPAIALREW